MSFDTRMFEQAWNCLVSLQQQVARLPWKVHVLDLGLSQDQVQRLKGEGVTVVRDEAQRIPVPNKGPVYFKAQGCRPFLRELFPGYAFYLWLDADLVLAAPDVLECYLRQADQDHAGLVIAQEVEPTYCFVGDPRAAQSYHRETHRRMLAVYGRKTADLFSGFYCYNSGLFAAHRESVIWDHYRENMLRALRTSTDHMLEQDAMNVAIFQSGVGVRSMPPTHNWLCSASMPMFDKRSKRWVRPAWPHLPIAVLHLCGSNKVVNADGKNEKLYAHYRRLGLTACQLHDRPGQDISRQGQTAAAGHRWP